MAGVTTSQIEGAITDLNQYVAEINAFVAGQGDEDTGVEEVHTAAEHVQQAQAWLSRAGIAIDPNWIPPDIGDAPVPKPQV